jgi:antitoxin FitA
MMLASCCQGGAVATITIRNVPDDVVKRIQEHAANHGKSMEQEVRDLLEQRFASRRALIDRVRARKGKMTGPSARKIRGWVDSSRDRP